MTVSCVVWCVFSITRVGVADLFGGCAGEVKGEEDAGPFPLLFPPPICTLSGALMDCGACVSGAFVHPGECFNDAQLVAFLP